MLTDIMILWTKSKFPNTNSLCREYIDYTNWCGCLGEKKCIRCVMNYNGWYLAYKKGDNLEEYYRLIINTMKR